MKRFMLTTALVAVASIGAHAQTATGDLGEAGQGSVATGTVPAFLASDFTGMTLHALDSEAAQRIQADADTGLEDGTMTRAERDRMRWASSDAFLAERDSWNSVGAIDDIVMTQDGEIRGVLIDVGGFLGFGARTVMVEIDRLTFVTDAGAPEAIDDFDVVIAMSQEQLEALPEWDEAQLRAGFPELPHRQGATPVVDSAMTGHPAADPSMVHAEAAVFDDGFTMLAADERTADRLIGADVYDATGESIGSVDDVVIATDNRITGLLVDVGGFLGVGAHTVALPIEDAQIGWRDADGDVRVQISMTREALEAMPEHDS